MATVEIVDKILIVTIIGEMNAEEVLKEAEESTDQSIPIIGQITDIRQMTAQPVAEQKKLEEARKALPYQVPHALLGKDSAISALVKVYVNYTKASDTRYFTDFEEAKAWIKSFQK
jgi:hypothetical protein